MRQVMSSTDSLRHVALGDVAVATVCNQPVDPRGVVMNCEFCEECEDFWNSEGASHGQHVEVRVSIRARARAGLPRIRSTFTNEPLPYIVVSARGDVSRIFDDDALADAEERLRRKHIEYAVYELRKVVRE